MIIIIAIYDTFPRKIMKNRCLIPVARTTVARHGLARRLRSVARAARWGLAAADAGDAGGATRWRWSDGGGDGAALRRAVADGPGRWEKIWKNAGKIMKNMEHMDRYGKNSGCLLSFFSSKLTVFRTSATIMELGSHHNLYCTEKSVIQAITLGFVSWIRLND